MTIPRPLLTAALLVSLAPAAQAEPPPSDPSRLLLEPIPAAKSGLDHVINSDAKLGELKYTWMSAPVDIDADGHLDLIVYGHHGGGSAVWLGDGRGAFRFDNRPYAERWVFAGRDPVWISVAKHGLMDAVGTEGSGVGGRVFLNQGDGHWQATEYVLPGRFQLCDLDGDGQHDESFDSQSGTAQKLEPALHNVAGAPQGKFSVRELWSAEKLVGFPEGVERGSGPGRAAYRDAYSVDLDGDHRNELVIHLKGTKGGFTTPELFSWVLAAKADAPAEWTDTTADCGLPTGVGHWFYPEDINTDGSLDMVDLHSGHWYANDGRGRFRQSATRVFDPEVRLPRRPGHPWTADNELQWIDLDNNGCRDLVTAADHSVNNGAFLNLGGGRFVESPDVPGGRRNRKFGDLNGDQRIDMVTFGDSRLTLHENRTPHGGISIRLAARVPARGHLGAKFWVYEAGRLGDAAALIDYQQGFMNRDDNRSHNLRPVFLVGLADRPTADVRVRFPSGVERELRGVKAGQEVELREVER
jgi:hypothetical protein